jgi:hypothetical protein
MTVDLFAGIAVRDYKVNAGRITAQRAYYDQMTLAAQLGLVPAAAPAS